MEDRIEKEAFFEKLFASPTIDAMLELSWQDFQDFVAFVFTSAGYSVEHVANQFFPHGPGVDLNLYVGSIQGRPVARVEVRRFAPGNKLAFKDIAEFIGVLKLAQGVPGYMVTTSDFNENAREAARQAKGGVHLINGEHLLRYITYVGGSRLKGEYAGHATMPHQPITPNCLEIADDIVARTTRLNHKPRILAVVNPKGGVAKTTTALNIGFSLTENHHQHVLLMDLDGQGSLTLSLPRPAPKSAPKDNPPPADDVTLSDYFRGQKRLNQLPRLTRFKNLFLAPSHHDLYRLHLGGEDRARAELKFVEDMRSLNIGETQNEEVSSLDWIILDTPAGESFYTRAALAAADYIVIPAFAETYALLGIREVLTSAKTMAALIADTAAWKGQVLGCLITRWKVSANATAALATIRATLTNEGIRLFQQAIPLDDRVETAHRGTVGGGLRSIFRLTSQMGQAATAYDNFVKEMLGHVNNRQV